MKTILGMLLVLVMAFAVVPTRAEYKGNHFNCISTPGYTHYVGVHEVPCPMAPIVTPNPMGTW